MRLKVGIIIAATRGEFFDLHENRYRILICWRKSLVAINIRLIKRT